MELTALWPGSMFFVCVSTSNDITASVYAVTTSVMAVFVLPPNKEHPVMSTDTIAATNNILTALTPLLIPDFTP